MKPVLLYPNAEVLPTRRTPPIQWKLDFIERAFRQGKEMELPDVIVFNTPDSPIMADGNHRFLMGILYQRPIRGLLLEKGEELKFVERKMMMRKGKEVVEYKPREYLNDSYYLNYIKFCRYIAQLRGYKTFQDLFKASFRLKENGLTGLESVVLLKG